MRHRGTQTPVKGPALPRMEEPNGMTSRRSSTSAVQAFAPIAWPTTSGPFAHQASAPKRKNGSHSFKASLGP